jgi:hypothetical protein
MHLFGILGALLIALGVGLYDVRVGIIAAGVALVVLDRVGVDLADGAEEGPAE